ncbi:TetR/AcrR family transcriptional regulator [Allosaccharopolyspora coralli]|uniref:TetR/AcrR family transcriptional regulator n=1 Tax=Allosaccharopolyspora coralli TaxID=2665642 RepID=UPI001E4B1DDB|nr:TetR/AcrR family transcriptional regulator [Allosaccharopolyspora coralli]
MALSLFTEHGFEATTVERIAEAADISPRTFFRHFPSKEAVLFGDLRREMARVREILGSRPPDEHPLRSLTVATLDVTDRMEPDRAQHRMRAELLNARHNSVDYELHLLRQQWVQELAELVAERLDVDAATDARPNAWSMTLGCCFGSAMHAWLTRTDGTPLRELFTEMLDETARGLGQAAQVAVSAR